MAHIVDILLIAVMVLVVVLSAKRGILLTLADFVSAIIAVLSAKLISPYISSYLYDNFVKERVMAILTEKFSSVGTSISSALSNIWQSLDFLPAGVKEFIKSSSVFDVEGVVSSAGNVANISEMEIKIIRPVLTSVLSIISFAVLAFFLAVVLRIVGRLIAKLVTKSKIAEKLDTLLGAVFGLLKAALYVFVLASVIVVISYNSETLASYTASSYICSFVGKFIG